MTHPLPTQNGVRPVQDVDGLLRDYFRAQMPDPWPALNAPATLAFVRPRSRWFRLTSRLAVAASIALLLLGYVALGGLFPKEPHSNGIEDLHMDIGKMPDRPVQRVTTPGGREALMNEEVINGDRPTIIINMQQLSGPQKQR